MKLKELDILLRENNVVEESEVTEDPHINEPIPPYHRLEVPKISKEPFFINGSIFINKHYHCPEMTSHTHDFVEINYMYAGQCTQWINGKQITLKQGQLLLMDKDVVQSIDNIGEDDILINILLQDESIATDIISNFVKSQSLVSEFLLHASRNEEEHNNFIFFDTTENEKIQILLKSLIAEFYGKERHMNQSLKLYMSLIFIELTKIMEQQAVEKYSQHEPEIIFILKFIEMNYVDISLESLAKEFGYNKNYLGNKLKQEVGKTFQELVNKKRLHVAYELITETNYSIEEIAYMVGYGDPSSFYKSFKKCYNNTPLQVRKKMA